MIADFYSDWVDMLRAHLALEGHAADPAEDGDKISVRYFNLKHRLILPWPRVVHRADTLSIPPEHWTAFQTICQKIERGESLKPHLSRKIADPDFNDLLLNDWDIHHLHLNTTLQADGLVRGTKELLFARFTGDAAYLIAFGDHDSWTRRDLLEVLVRNWPEIMERCRIRGLDGLSRNVSEESHERLRKAGVTALIQLSNGCIYAAGGGYARNGLSMRVRMTVDRFRKAVEEVEQWTRENLSKLRERTDPRLPVSPHFKLTKVTEDKTGITVEIMELQTQQILRFPAVR